MRWVGTPNVANYRLQTSAEIYSEYHAISIKQSNCFISQSSAVDSCWIAKRISGAHSTNCHMRSGVLQGERWLSDKVRNE